ncbi:uncharacterized protein B0T15DRAFT_525171 [Chaetomium strumarium]|uniref:Uncharacterized protein n=1 Tax=Chaetomium strumarium TaxID=1170767 RepID=A0AAJ0GZ02_9PEZI|nr:hypothetical protein B0T15DRAFT_525171 [Chaetomium strumarium]
MESVFVLLSGELVMHMVVWCGREEAQPQVAGWNYHTKREALTLTALPDHCQTKAPRVGMGHVLFLSVNRATSTALASSAVHDVTTREKAEAADSMESFWMGETLKYFPPDLQRRGVGQPG